MNIGTKSILFGAHAFYLHPWFVAAAWWRLYGFPWDPRLWVAFFVHDLGYWGKPNMDGEEGEEHPFFGAFVMKRLFGDEWFEFCLYHSRYLAKRDRKPYTRLCVADKLSLTMEPSWLYVPRCWATGEIREYMAVNKHQREMGVHKSMWVWHREMKAYMYKWVTEHKDGREDTWTQADRSDAQ
jgi:hypothetical protein